LQHLRLSELKNRILTAMEKNYKTIELLLPYDQGRIIHQAQEGVEVLNREYEAEGIKLKIRGSQSRIQKILRATAEH
jgi:50S ribosomal subunit-associated GTPase HflX